MPDKSKRVLVVLASFFLLHFLFLGTSKAFPGDLPYFPNVNPDPGGQKLRYRVDYNISGWVNFWPMDGTNYGEIWIKKNATNCSPTDYHYKYDTFDRACGVIGNTVHNTNIWVNPGDYLCVYRGDPYDPTNNNPNYNCAAWPNPYNPGGLPRSNGDLTYPMGGWSPKNPDGSCGENPTYWDPIPASTINNHISTQQNWGGKPIVAQWCENDWPDANGGVIDYLNTVDNDYNDWFTMWSVQPQNTCSISLSSTNVNANPSRGTVNVTVTGKAWYGDGDPNSNEIKVWITRRTPNTGLNEDQIPQYATSVIPSVTEATYNGIRHYNVPSAGCSSTGGATCTKTTTLQLPAGRYYVFCDANTQGVKCSGSPYCDFYGGSYDCQTPSNYNSSWEQCSPTGADHSSLDVNLPCPTVTNYQCDTDGAGVTLTYTPVAASYSASYYRVRLDMSPLSWFTPTNGDQYIDNYIGTTSDIYNGEASGSCANDSTCHFDITPGVNYGWGFQGATPKDGWSPPIGTTNWNACGWESDTINCAEPQCTVATSCSPAALQIGGGNSACTTTITGVQPTGTSLKVRYTSSPTGIVGISPTVRTSTPYSTTVSPQAIGSTTLYTYVDMPDLDQQNVCNTSDGFFVTAADPWWQVNSADVWTTGSIESDVPSGLFFDNAVSPTPPGVSAYKGTLNTNGATRISSERWRANTNSIFDASVFPQAAYTYDYDFFWNSVPTDTVFDEITSNTPTFSQIDDACSNGYCWVHYDGASGNLNLSGEVPDGYKFVIFAESNVVVGANLTLGPTGEEGLDFLMVIATGNIYANNHNTAPNRLEGIFISNGSFYTGGATGVTNANQLIVRGSVIAWNGIELNREIPGADNIDTPSERFVYLPQLILNIPPYFGGVNTKWKEVAP